MFQEIKNLASYPKKLLSSIVKIFTTPSLLLYSIIPYVVSIVIFVFLFKYGYGKIDSLIDHFTQNNQGFLYMLLWGISFLIISMFTSVASFIGLLVIGGIFIDFMIENELVRVNALKKEAFSLEQFFKQNFKSIVADLVVIFVIFLCALISFVISFIPFLSIIPILIGMFTLGLSLFDRVMSVATYSPVERTNYFKSHKMQILMIGFFFTVVFCIPFASIVFMPPALLMITDFFEVKTDDEKNDDKISFGKKEDKQEDNKEEDMQPTISKENENTVDKKEERDNTAEIAKSDIVEVEDANLDLDKE